MTKEEYDKYALTVLTDEQMEELEERYFKHDIDNRIGQRMWIEGQIDPITILAAADYIRSLDTFKENVHELYFSVKGKSYKFVGGDYDMQLKACDDCALKKRCDQFIDDNAINICQMVGVDKIGVKGKFQPTPKEELERMREYIEKVISN